MTVIFSASCGAALVVGLPWWLPALISAIGATLAWAARNHRMPGLYPVAFTFGFLGMALTLLMDTLSGYWWEFAGVLSLTVVLTSLLLVAERRRKRQVD